jgi:cytochrome c5
MIVSRTLLAALACAAAVPALAAGPNDVLPAAPAKAVILRACVMCHEASFVVAKRRTADQWDEVVGKMVDRGAAVDEDEQEAIVAYLAKYFGPTSANPAAK